MLPEISEATPRPLEEPPAAAWSQALAELQASAGEGWRQIVADGQALGRTLARALRSLRLDEIVHETRREVATLWQAAGEAWAEVRADAELLAAVGQRELARLPLQPAQRWLGARWATVQQAGAASRRWVAARADELPLAEIKAGLSAAWAAGRRWAGPRVHTLRLGLAQRAAVVAGWPAVAAARRLVDEGRRRWQTWLRQPRLLRYLVLADSALAGSIVVILTVTAPALQAAGPSLPAELRAGLPRGAARVGLAVPAAPLPTATPPPTPAPTATPEPVLTATPIPNFYTEWESWLPTQGGWNGLGECWGNVLAPAGAGRFVWPTDKRYLVGKDYNWRWHPGLDLGGDVGDPIYAADSGVVVYAGWNVYGFGNLVIVDHGNNWHTLYAHLSEILVTCGEGVEQGALLGLAGSTGHSTGPHLHFEIRSGGVNVNPWDYLPAP